jgi:hypothetical protein
VSAVVTLAASRLVAVVAVAVAVAVAVGGGRRQEIRQPLMDTPRGCSEESPT